MCRIAHIRSCLIVDANGVEGGECGVDEEGYQGVEDICDEHDPFDQKDEYGEDRDHHIVVGSADTF